MGTKWQCRTCGCPLGCSMFQQLPWVPISGLWVLTCVAAQAGLCPQAQIPSQHWHHGRRVPSAWSSLHSLSKCCHSEITPGLNSTSARIPWHVLPACLAGKMEQRGVEAGEADFPWASPDSAASVCIYMTSCCCKPTLTAARPCWHH